MTKNVLCVDKCTYLYGKSDNVLQQNQTVTKNWYFVLFSILI